MRRVKNAILNATTDQRTFPPKAGSSHHNLADSLTFTGPEHNHSFVHRRPAIDMLEVSPSVLHCLYKLWRWMLPVVRGFCGSDPTIGLGHKPPWVRIVD